MIKDIFFSLKDTVKTKTTNPFFGTLIIVWVIHSWELIFTFFNFEIGTNLKDKIEFLRTYLGAKPFLNNLIECIGITLLVLIATYFLLNLSRLIVNLFEKRITPWVYKITDSNSIVLKSNFKLLEKERDVLSQKLEMERETKLRLQNDISRLENRIKELITPQEKQEQTPNEEPEKKLTSEKVKLLLDDITEKNMITFFDTLINQINNEDYIDINISKNEINYFLKADIIKLKDKNWTYDNLRHFIFTNLGTKVKEEFVMKNLNK